MIQINYKKIKEKRHDYGYTQEKLAKLSEVKSQSTISRLEKGEVKESIIEFFRVMYSLDLEITDIVEIAPCEKRQILEELKLFRLAKDFKSITRVLESKPPRFWNKSNELFCHYYWYQAIVLAMQEEYREANIFIDKVIERIKETKHYTYLLPEILLAKGNIECSLGQNAIKYYEEAQKNYNPKSSLNTYQNYVKIHYALAGAYCRQEKFFLALEHLNKALKEVNQYNSNFLRLEIEWAKYQLFVKHKKEEVDAQRQVIIGLATSFNQLEYLEQIKNYAYMHN